MRRDNNDFLWLGGGEARHPQGWRLSLSCVVLPAVVFVLRLSACHGWHLYVLLTVEDVTVMVNTDGVFSSVFPPHTTSPFFQSVPHKSSLSLLPFPFATSSPWIVIPTHSLIPPRPSPLLHAISFPPAFEGEGCRARAHCPERLTDWMTVTTIFFF